LRKGEIWTREITWGGGSAWDNRANISENIFEFWVPCSNIFIFWNVNFIETFLGGIPELLASVEVHDG
jgi:hypothetical protein